MDAVLHGNEDNFKCSEGILVFFLIAPRCNLFFNKVHDRYSKKLIT